MPAVAGMLPVSFERISLDFRVKQFVHAGMHSYPAAHFLWMRCLSSADRAALYSDDFAAALKVPALDGFVRHLPAFHGTDRPLTELMNYDLATQLPGKFNVKVDMMSMAHALEVRSPFFDHRLVEICQRIPDRFKVRGLQTKYLLRRMMAAHLPRRITRIPKRGFTIPLAHWLTTTLRPMALEELSEDRVRQMGYFRYSAVARLLGDHMARRRDNSRQIWALISLARWHRAFIG